MKTLIERRDGGAEEFWNNIKENSETIHAKTIYKHGFDASSDIWRAETKALVAALENGFHSDSTITEALEAFKARLL